MCGMWQRLVLSGVLAVLVLASAARARSYNNGLIFYDAQSLQVFLPPTISVSRGRTLASMKYSEKGSIWSTFGKPCDCRGAVCGCCAGIKVKQYNFDQKMCANVTFVSAKNEAILDVFLNEQPSARYGISANNPAPFCIPVMLAIPMAMCIQMSNIALVDNNLGMCMDFVVRLATTDLFEMHFQCMQMGVAGLQYLDKDGRPVLPQEPSGTRQEADEYEYGEYNEYYDELPADADADADPSENEVDHGERATEAPAGQAEPVTAFSIVVPGYDAEEEAEADEDGAAPTAVPGPSYAMPNYEAAAATAEDAQGGERVEEAEAPSAPSADYEAAPSAPLPDYGASAAADVDQSDSGYGAATTTAAAPAAELDSDPEDDLSEAANYFPAATVAPLTTTTTTASGSANATATMTTTTTAPTTPLPMEAEGEEAAEATTQADVGTGSEESDEGDEEDEEGSGDVAGDEGEEEEDEEEEEEDTEEGEAEDEEETNAEVTEATRDDPNERLQSADESEPVAEAATAPEAGAERSNEVSEPESDRQEAATAQPKPIRFDYRAAYG